MCYIESDTPNTCPLSKQPSTAQMHLLEHQLNDIRQRATHCFNDYSVHEYDREDLVQETVFALYNKLRAGIDYERGPIEHYINRTIRRRKLDYRRKKINRQRIFETYVQKMMYQNQCHHQVHGNPIDSALRSGMLLEVFNEVLTTMTPMERQVCQYLYQEWKPAEIAQAMAIDPKKVYNAIYRVRQKLKVALQSNVD